MRYYKLVFSGSDTKTTTSKSIDKNDKGTSTISVKLIERKFNNYFELELNEKNPYALGIKFNIQSFYDSSTYTPSSLQIINPPTEFFSQSRGLVGMNISITAGIKQSIFTKKLDLTPSTNDLLWTGIIARAIPQWSGINPSVSLLLTNTLIDNNSEENNGNYICKIEKGEIIADGIKNTLNEMFPKVQVEINEDAKSITLADKQTNQREIKNFRELSNFASQLNLGLAVESNKVIIYSTKEGYEIKKTPFMPKPQDFLSQPEWQNDSTIQCSFGMRGDLSLRQIIKMPSMVSNASALLGSGDSTGSLAGISNANAVILSNEEFKITGIWHSGDSRNSGALAWATTISATNETNLANK